MYFDASRMVIKNFDSKIKRDLFEKLLSLHLHRATLVLRNKLRKRFTDDMSQIFKVVRQVEN
jgi:hypothetical protein